MNYSQYNQIKIYGIIWSTVFIAIILQIIPLNSYFYSIRPNFILLIIFFWITTKPYYFNIYSSCLIGIILDTLYSNTIGVNGIIYACFAFIIYRMHLLFKHFHIIKQMLFIFTFTLSYQLILYHSKYVINGNAQIHWENFQNIITTTLCWPWLYWLLTQLQEKHKIHHNTK